MPSRIFSMSLWRNLRDLKKCNENKNLTYSVARTAKLLLPPATSYQPISCRINDWKYFIRIRVICRRAVWLKPSTAKMPEINWTSVETDNNIPYDMESSMIADSMSGLVAPLVLHFLCLKISRWTKTCIYNEICLIYSFAWHYHACLEPKIVFLIVQNLYQLTDFCRRQR